MEHTRCVCVRSYVSMCVFEYPFADGPKSGGSAYYVNKLVT